MNDYAGHTDRGEERWLARYEKALLRYERTVRFLTHLEECGFPSGHPLTRIVENGTYFESAEISPYLGMSRDVLVKAGYTVSDEVKNGRRTVVTRTEVPIMHFFSIQSAHYAVARDLWRSKDGRSIWPSTTIPSTDTTFGAS